MKKLIPIFIIAFLILQCKSEKSDIAFINKISGRYLFNEDELIKVYNNNDELHIDWRGTKNIKPLQIDRNTFFIKEINNKIQFEFNPKDSIDYIVLVPKDKDEEINFDYPKMAINQKLPKEYLQDNEFDKALEAYIKIKQKDSLNPIIIEGHINRLGYHELGNKNYEMAINYFKININLYPKNSNVYDSLGEAFMKSGDTITAIEYYSKAVSINPENRGAKRQLDKLKKDSK